MKKKLLTILCLFATNYSHANYSLNYTDLPIVVSSSLLVAGTGALMAGIGSLIKSLQSVSRDARVRVEKEAAKQKIRIIKAENKFLKKIDTKQCQIQKLKNSKKKLVAHKNQIQNLELEITELKLELQNKRTLLQ